MLGWPGSTMDKKWLRLRTAVTIIMALIGIGLLAVAWLSIGHVPGEAVADLGVLGLAIPIGVYALFTLVGWQRSVGTNVPPSALIAWCLRNRLAMILPFAFGIFVFLMFQNLAQVVDRHLEEQRHQREND